MIPIKCRDGFGKKWLFRTKSGILGNGRPKREKYIDEDCEMWYIILAME